MSKTIDLTPTWSSLVNLFVHVLSEQEFDADSRNGIIESIKSMAAIADEYVTLAKAAGMNPNSINTEELINRVKQKPEAETDDHAFERKLPGVAGPEYAYPNKLFLSKGNTYIRAGGVHGWNIAKMEYQPPYTYKTAKKLVLAYNYHDKLYDKLKDLIDYLGKDRLDVPEIVQASQLLNTIKAETL